MTLPFTRPTQRLALALALLLVVFLALVAAAPAPGVAAADALAAPEAQGAVLDPRLGSLGVRVQPAADCSAGCYRVIGVTYLDANESGGLHHIYGSVSGPDVRWTVTWYGNAITYQPGQNHGMYRGEPPSWGGCYDWPNVLGGPFDAFAGTVQARSDTVIGMGLPQCAHVVFNIAWAWVPAGAPPSPTAPPSTATPVPPQPSPTPAPPGSTPPPAPGGLAPVIGFEGALYLCGSPEKMADGSLLVRCRRPVP